MLEINVDPQAVKDLIHRRIADLIKEVDAELVYWDTKELTRRTCMCINSIKESFFYDPRFPKYKIGTKWYFPARETREFLVVWLSEQ